MKKKLQLIVFIGITILLCSCKRNSALTEEEFTSITKNHKLTVVDVTEQFESKKQVKGAYVADSGNDYQIEYFVFDSENSAKDMYNKNKDDFKSTKSNKDKEKESNDTYTTTTSDYFMYISRIENSVLYIKVPISVKEEIQKIIKELKY